LLPLPAAKGIKALLLLLLPLPAAKGSTAAAGTTTTAGAGSLGLGEDFGSGANSTGMLYFLAAAALSTSRCSAASLVLTVCIFNLLFALSASSFVTPCVFWQYLNIE
jgi:hypothetical protein